MREFKFRAWVREEDERYSHMVDSPRSIITILEHILMVGRPMGFSDCDSRPYPERYVLMQYTGLKDKNGREIYEGDIVLYDRNIHKDIDTAKFKVVWAKDRYVLQEIKHKYYIDDVTWELVEVIGNIYENPELMEG